MNAHVEVFLICDVILRMKATRSSKIFVSYHITARRHNPEDNDLNLYHRENLKSCKINFIADILTCTSTVLVLKT
jgi:hypothetical protein